MKCLRPSLVGSILALAVVQLSAAENKPAAKKELWAVRPLVMPAVPTAAPKGSSSIDAFIRAKLKEKKLSPAPEADRRTLIRRLTFDLHGLPPTPEEVESFVHDRDPRAYEKLVDRLLASPRYGERWGRHWLDVVHYGETHGYDKDARRPNAWPYRDYVIKSFNEDKPYGRFIREQLAGDVLFTNDPDGIIATGFIVAGPWDKVGQTELKENTTDKKITRLLDRDDMVANTIGTFCSLTVHCARCHDHKFDPIPQRDYYSLQAVFAGIDRADRSCDPGTDSARAALQAQKTDLEKELEKLKAERGTNSIAIELDQQTGLTTRRLNEVNERIKALPKPRTVYAAATHFSPEGTFTPPSTPRPVYLLERGDVNQPKELRTAGALSCVTNLTCQFELTDSVAEGQRRVALADWIADPKNAITWRSIVNRVWSYHFGRGIVDSPNDFGNMGSLPTHPELLDWLALEFLTHGESLKWLQKQFVMSATYRQSCAYREDFALIDSGNQFLWRMNRDRLDAESIHDAMLSIAGKLDLTMGGPGYDLFEFQDDFSPHYYYEKHAVDDPKGLRRSVYRTIVRSVPDPMQETLDCADPSQSVPVRNTTLTALQALTLRNNPFCLRMAELFAERLKKISTEPAKQIEQAYVLALGRKPTPNELSRLRAHTEKYGLVNTCRLIFNNNEFMFVD